MINVGQAVGYLLLDTTGFTDGLKQASNHLKVFQDDTATASDKFAGVGAALTSSGKVLTKNVTLPLVGLGGVAVKTAATFESAMSQVQATMGLTSDSVSTLNGQTVNTMDALSDLAKEMGAKTKFSATEAAEAINNMAMAGYSVEEVYQALPEVLNLASAGALDLDYATQLAANGLNVMGLGVDSLADMSDKLAVTASNAYGSVSDFGEGLLVTGGAASSANLSLTDTFTALGILGDNGIAASEGGTKLRNVLLSLYAPTDSAAKVLTALGIETEDANGNVRDFQSVLQDLNGSLEQMSEADKIKTINEIFNKQDLAAVNALLKDSGDRWDELSNKIDNAGGAASQMADTQLDNLQGQLTILRSALEGAAISFGDILLPVVKDVVEWIQKAVDWVNSLSQEQKEAIARILEIAATLGPILLIGGKLAGGISKIISLVSGAGGLVGVISSLAGPIGIVVAAVAAFAAAWATDFAGIREYTDEIFGYLKSIFETVSEFIRKVWDENWGGIKDIVSFVWDTVETITRTTFDVITNLFKIFDAFIKGDWKGVWEGIKNIAKAAWNALVHIVEGLMRAVWNTIKNIGRSIWNGIVDFVNGVIGKIKEVFSWLGGGSSKSSEISAKGSFASGLDYVPRDMLVKVHEGERILTKEENAKRVSQQPTFGTVNINIEGAKYSDEKELAQVIAYEIQHIADRREAVWT